MLAPMDAGAPISYEVLEQGTPVYSADETQIGTVAHVLADAAEDVFDGIVIAEREGARVHEHRFVDADYVASIHERAVTLKLDAAACADLPKPDPNPAVMRDDPMDAPLSPLQSKVRRAWELLSGKY
jgi:uncharacterized protein YrrD